MARTNHEEVTKRILERLDVAAEYRALGVDLAGEPGPDGWAPCRAVDREDRTPSAAINIHTGRYKDHGGDGESLSLWDFAAKHGKSASWQEAKQYFAAKVGVQLNGSPAAKNPTQHLDFRDWNDAIAALWCRHKPGVAPVAVRAVGGRLARYRQRFTVIALPVWGMGEAEPIGWVLYNTTGRTLPVFQGGGPPKQVKMLSTAGSKAGLMGEVAKLADAPPRATVWKTEGPSDLLALWSALPTDSTDIIVCNSQGAKERPKQAVVDYFRGHHVNVVHDADNPGQEGAAEWTSSIARVAESVRNVQLPFETAENHGKDLRDYFAGGTTFGDLQQLAAEAPMTEEGKIKPIEADDDPFRLAELFITRNFPPVDDANRLRCWRQEWWSWNGQVYQTASEDEIKAAVATMAREEFTRINIEAQQEEATEDGPTLTRKVTRNVTGNIMGALMSRTIVPDKMTQPNWLDHESSEGQSSNCISLANGILDMDALMGGRDEGVLLPHTPRWFSRVTLPYDFDPEATCPHWKAFLAQCLDNDSDRIALLQEWAGYLLTPDTGQQKFLVLEGEGSNGKSVFCAAMEAMVGQDNTAHIPLEVFGQRFALHETLGKLVNIAADCGELDRVAEGHLKSFTSGDRMFFDRKGKPGISASPTARLMLATNNRPRFSDKSSGVWRRMILVPMTVEIAEADQIANMDKPVWWEASGELPGVFCWAVAGLARLRKNKRFTRPAICEEAIEEYRSEINPTRLFLQDHYEASQEEIRTTQVYLVYKAWCIQNGYKSLGERMFGKEVKRCFSSVVRRRMRTCTERYYVYDGLSISADVEKTSTETALT